MRAWDARHTGEMPWFPHIMTPIRVFDNRKPFHFPIPITIPKFIEACLHNVCEVGHGLWCFLGLWFGVEPDAVKFIPCLLCSRHECLDPWLWDWATLLIGEKAEPRGDLPMITLLFSILDPVFLVPMGNIGVIFLIQWLRWIMNIKAIRILLVGGCIRHQMDLRMLMRCKLVDYILQLWNESSRRETISCMCIYDERVGTYLCACNSHLAWRWSAFTDAYAAFPDRIRISWDAEAIVENIEAECEDKDCNLCQYKRISRKNVQLTSEVCVWLKAVKSGQETWGTLL